MPVILPRKSRANCLSTRSVKMLIQKACPETPISDEAVRILVLHIEEHGRAIAEQASRIHHRENELRKSIGERVKRRLSPKHMRMAIDGKFEGRIPEGDKDGGKI